MIIKIYITTIIISIGIKTLSNLIVLKKVTSLGYKFIFFDKILKKHLIKYAISFIPIINIFMALKEIANILFLNDFIKNNFAANTKENDSLEETGENDSLEGTGENDSPEETKKYKKRKQKSTEAVYSDTHRQYHRRRGHRFFLRHKRDSELRGSLQPDFVPAAVSSFTLWRDSDRAGNGICRNLLLPDCEKRTGKCRGRRRGRNGRRNGGSGL